MPLVLLSLDNMRRNYPASEKWILVTTAPENPAEWMHAYANGKRLDVQGTARRTIERARNPRDDMDRFMEPERRWFLANFELGEFYEVVI